MALNVPLQHGNDGPFPLPFPAEEFLLTRDKVHLSFRDGAGSYKSLKGRLFMTNLRIVYLIAESDRRRANDTQTFEMPFRGLWDERFNQPIFGCNNLTATIQYYDDQPFSGTLSMRLDFVQGGVNTFLPIFNNVLRATRIQLQAESQSSENSTPAPIPASAPSSASLTSNESLAFVDPSDPSRIYTTQPVTENAARRTDVPSWNPSAEGLRRRR